MWISTVFGQDLNGRQPQKEEFEVLNLKNFASKVVMNNIDSFVDKPDLNGGYRAIEQYRYVSIRIGSEPEIYDLCSTHIDFYKRI